MMAQTQIDQLCINTIRTLSMDAIQHANSGHPGSVNFDGFVNRAAAKLGRDWVRSRVLKTSRRIDL
jgi:hypothetical protein